MGPVDICTSGTDQATRMFRGGVGVDAWEPVRPICGFSCRNFPALRRYCVTNARALRLNADSEEEPRLVSRMDAGPSEGGMRM